MNQPDFVWDDEKAERIISARKAEPKETRDYEQRY